MSTEQTASQAGCFVIVIGLAFVFLLCCLDNCEKGQACEKRGGHWYCAYKTECVCLANGTVIE